MSNPFIDFAKGLVFDDKGNIDPRKVLGIAGTAAGLAAINNSDKVKDFLGIGGNQQPIGYTGGIPEYNVSRGLAPDAFSTVTPTGEPRRPGSMGRRYFTDTTFTPTGQTMSGNVGPVTAPATPAEGLFSSLSPERATALLRSLFGTGGISGAPPPAATTTTPPPAATTTTTTPPPAATTTTPPPAATTTTTTPPPAATTTTTTPPPAATTTTPPFVLTPPPAVRYTDASVKAAIDKIYANFGGPGATAHEQIAKAMSDYGLPVDQVARVTGFTPAEVSADYSAFGKFSDKDILDFVNSTYSQYGGPGAEAHKVIADAMNQYGVTPAQVARATGYSPEAVAADYKAFGYAAGGLASLPKSRGYYLGGATDGMADDIPATINNTEPAALSDGEFVIPADVVSHLGNGNSDAGAKQLYAMMDRVRRARTGREEQGRKINPTRYTPV